jgi:hypothetical protein
MSPGELLMLVQAAIQAQSCLSVTYKHKRGDISTHTVVPYSVEPGARSKTGEPMLWAWCLDHGRLEQRIPANIISIDAIEGDWSAAPAGPSDAGGGDASGGDAA